MRTEAQRGFTSHGTNPQPFEFRRNPVGATLVVARATSPAQDGPVAWTAGRDKPVPYGRVPCASAPRPRGGNPHGTNPQPVEIRHNPVGATLVVARATSPAQDGTVAWTAGRDKPVPYGRVPCASAPRPRGGNPHGTNPQPVEIRRNPVGATLVVARATSPAQDGPVAWTAGRDKPVPYGRVPCAAPRPRGGNPHGTNPQPVEIRHNPVGATLVVARATSPAQDGPVAWTTGRDKPVPYGRVPCASAPRPRGGNPHGTNPQPVEIRHNPVGATLVVARATSPAPWPRTAWSVQHGRGQAPPLRSLFRAYSRSLTA